MTEFEKYATRHRGISSITMAKYTSAINNSLTPYIVEERQLNVAQMDVFSRLMMDRIIFLGTAIDDYTANVIQAQLLFMENMDPEREITMYLNSPGGSVYAGLSIYDTMQLIQPKVSTICTGLAASMASVLLCAGEKGRRSALPHSRVMIHQPMVKLKKELDEIIALHSGQPYEQVEKDSDRDHWFTAEEALAYGMIDEVVKKKA